MLLKIVSKLALRLVTNTKGSIAPLMALILPILLGAAGLTMDYAFMRLKQSQLQDAADLSAIAATQELSVALKSTTYIDSVVKSYVAGAFDVTSDLTIASVVEGENDTVAVKLSLAWTPFFAQYFNATVTPIVVNAKAKIAGTGKICVLGLMADKLAGIHLDDKSRMEAGQCGAYSNSLSDGSIRADKGATAKASVFCAAGGIASNKKASFDPLPTTDCPVVPDPLANRIAPVVGACDWSNKVVSGNVTLDPGVYCGGLRLIGNAKAVLKPGTYIIKDGPLSVEETASLDAVSVGFFLTGDDSLIDFHEGTHINLQAPISGDMAGLLFFEDLNVNHKFNFKEDKIKDLLKSGKKTKGTRVHIISSNDAKQLLGTIYLARSVLLINANAPVASESAYTAIVVGRLWLQKGPTLVLNADYSVTEVPVPAGLAGGRSRLIQ